ncbi:MAG: lipid-A-disaccharide synthase [Fimbriimonadales bacterium]
MFHPLVWITAGEASGDVVGSLLCATLKTTRPDLRIHAVGGSRLRAAADELLADSSEWGAIGIVRSLPKVPRVYAAYRRLLKRASRESPHLHIPIDFGAFNIPLARRLRARGSRVLYYMPPGSWRKDRQGTDLPAIADVIATPFEWSARLLQLAGARAEFVGHPLRDLAPAPTDTSRDRVLALLPGSRDHEIRANLPVMASACDHLARQIPDLRFEVAPAPTVRPEAIRRAWSTETRLPLTLAERGPMDLLARARAAIVCSGSATLEAAVCRCPIVVMYRGDWLMHLEWRIRRPRFEFVALPSIVLGRQLCPELLQAEATPERIAQECIALLQDGPTRQAQLDGFEEVIARLGPPGATERTAHLALSLLPEAGAAGC